MYLRASDRNGAPRATKAPCEIPLLASPTMRWAQSFRRHLRPLLAAFAAGAAAIAAFVVRNASRGARTARNRWERRPGAHAAVMRARSREPLANLYEVHPEALNAAPRELGLQTITTDRIRGTAVQGPQQRGGDFLPLPAFRSTNWEARWQRIRNAVEQLAVLPPIEVVKYGDDYWVTDGHNRVAAANYFGQVGVDALVTELRQPGRSFERPAPGMAAVLTEGRALRAAGQGRLASTTALPLETIEHDGTIPSREEAVLGVASADNATTREERSREPAAEGPPGL